MPDEVEYVRGWAGPLAFGSDGNLQQATNENCIATDLVQILDERKGEWYLNPNHGSTISDMVFEKNDAIFKAQLTSKIQVEVGAQETRAKMGNVAIRQGEDTKPFLPLGQLAESAHHALVLIPFTISVTGAEKVAVLSVDRGTRQ